MARWWRAEVADAAPHQLTAGSGAGEAELAVRGEDTDGWPGTPFGQPRSTASAPVGLARAAKVDQDAGARMSWCHRSRIAGARCSTGRRTAGGVK